MSIFTILLWSVLISLTFSDFYNSYFDRWYVITLIFCYVPLFFAAIFFLSWLAASSKNQHQDLKRLPSASILAIISILLAQVTLVVYIMKFYKYDYVYTGYQPWDENDAKYIKQTKLSYIAISSGVSIVLISIYGYVCYQTVEAGNRYVEQPKMMDEDLEEDEMEKMMG
jgi:hypothetical protein